MKCVLGDAEWHAELFCEHRVCVCVELRLAPNSTVMDVEGAASAAAPLCVFAPRPPPRGGGEGRTPPAVEGAGRGLGGSQVAIAREIEPVRARDRPCGGRAPRARERQTELFAATRWRRRSVPRQRPAGMYARRPPASAAASAGVARERYSAGQSLSSRPSASAWARTPAPAGTSGAAGSARCTRARTGTRMAVRARTQYRRSRRACCLRCAEKSSSPTCSGRRGVPAPCARVERAAARDSRARTGARQARRRWAVACMRAVPALLRRGLQPCSGNFCRYLPRVQRAGSLVLQERLVTTWTSSSSTCSQRSRRGRPILTRWARPAGSGAVREGVSRRAAARRGAAGGEVVRLRRARARSAARARERAGRAALARAGGRGRCGGRRHAHAAAGG